VLCLVSPDLNLSIDGAVQLVSSTADFIM